MADRIDAERLKRESSLQALIEQDTELKPSGSNELIGRCPFHDEQDASFHVYTNPDDQHYHCYGCEEHGDVFEYLRLKHGLDFISAANHLSGESIPLGKSPSPASVAAGRAPSPYEGVCAVRPVPADIDAIKTGTTISVYNPKRAGSEQEIWNIDVERADEYRDPNGDLMAYVLRTSIKGRKVTPTVQWCEWDEGECKGWAVRPFETPRPLQGLDDLRKRPDAPVLIVEGEKCRAAACKLLPDYVSITWPGGTASVGKAEWGWLKNRRVLCWPDADSKGLQAMTHFIKDAEIIRQGVKGLLPESTEYRLIGWDTTKEKGWDCADALEDGWKTVHAIEWAKSMIVEDVYQHMVDVGVIGETSNETQVENRTDDPDSPPIEAYENETGETSREPDPPRELEYEDHFQILGHNNGKYYFLPRATGQVVKISPKGFDRNTLVTLAPSYFWYGVWPGKGTWASATEFLITAAHRVGVFHESDTVRGRGAWIDEGRKVIHLGNRLNVDGYPQPNSEFESDYIYPEGRKIRLALEGTVSATDAQAKQLLDINSRFSWDNKISGVLLSGWCVIAPVCGILNWRPHVWVTGESGCGKSTVVKDVVRAMLKDFSLELDGSTTEAGIRQTLGQDALPILFDEIETETLHDDQRVTAILKTIRVASSGGEIVKGSASGQVIRYTMRSCFCLSSINMSAVQRADKSRLTTLWLRKDESDDAGPRYEQLADDMKETFTPGYASAMLARTVQHLDVLLQNCESFTHAAAKVFKDRRTADQFGTMFAGAYLCESTDAISHQDAQAWIEAHGEGLESFQRQAEEKDCRALLEKICASRIDVEWTNNKGPTQRMKFTIGKAINTVAYSQGMDGEILMKEAIKDRLIEAGIRVEYDPDQGMNQTFLIANKGSDLTALLRGTPWSNNWNRTLQELPGALASEGSPKYFGHGNRQRATLIPMGLIATED